MESHPGETAAAAGDDQVLCSVAARPPVFVRRRALLCVPWFARLLQAHCGSAVCVDGVPCADAFAALADYIGTGELRVTDANFVGVALDAEFLGLHEAVGPQLARYARTRHVAIAGFAAAPAWVAELACAQCAADARARTASAAQRLHALASAAAVVDSWLAGTSRGERPKSWAVAEAQMQILMQEASTNVCGTAGGTALPAAAVAAAGAVRLLGAMHAVRLHQALDCVPASEVWRACRDARDRCGACGQVVLTVGHCCHRRFHPGAFTTEGYACCGDRAVGGECAFDLRQPAPWRGVFFA
eukprot:TRINITY_DN1276_c0_g1_i2.p2 TRINITY_DN1276_c0_g1~~TRINITY_DN1276_c0_g1_i2.p2  ORF type:complete len:301 (+),score=76.51 TRINITY_DN1276_c0_g1_i2:79-981(+)